MDSPGHSERNDATVTSSQRASLFQPDLFFWGFFWLLTALLLLPLWYGEMPPLTDFGGHVQLTEGFIRATDPDSVWSTLVERRDNWWFPNMVLARLSALVHPVLDPLTAMRLWMTLTLGLTALGYVRVLAVFGRSRWLIFIVLPILTWNGMAALGFVNYLPSLAIVPWSMIAARRLGGDATWRLRDAVLVSVLPVFAVWFHGFGGLVVMGATGLVLFSSLNRLKRSLALATLAPAFVYWLAWFLATRPINHPKSSRDDFLPWLQTLAQESLGLFAGHEDNRILFALAVCLAMAFAASIWRSLRQSRTQDVASGRTDASRDSSRAARFWRWVNDHPLELVAVSLLVAYRLLPRYVGDFVIADRLIPVLVATICMLPRASMFGPGAPIARTCVVLAMTTTLIFSIVIGRATVRFDSQELAAARPLIDQIPENTRAQCVGVKHARPFFERVPLDHGCSGLLAVKRRTFSGGGFADTAHNAIALKPGVAEHRIFDTVWTRKAEFELVDWVLVRGNHGRPNSDWAELVDEVRGPDGQPRWTLYKSRVSVVPPAAFEAEAGGRGGRPFFSDCAQGQVVTGFTLNQRKEHSAFGGIGVRCRKLARDKAGELTVSGQTKTLSTHGSAGGSRRTLTCPRATPAVGLDLQGDSLVRAVAIECATPVKDGLGIPFVPWLGRARGGIVVDHDPERWVSMGEAPTTRLRCPPNMMLTGIRGRAGTLVDALGVRCTPLAELLTTEARPPKRGLTSRER